MVRPPQSKKGNGGEGGSQHTKGTAQKKRKAIWREVVWNSDNDDDTSDTLAQHMKKKGKIIKDKPSEKVTTARDPSVVEIKINLEPAVRLSAIDDNMVSQALQVDKPPSPSTQRVIESLLSLSTKCPASSTEPVLPSVNPDSVKISSSSLRAQSLCMADATVKVSARPSVIPDSVKNSDVYIPGWKISCSDALDTPESRRDFFDHAIPRMKVQEPKRVSDATLEDPVRPSVIPDSVNNSDVYIPAWNISCSDALDTPKSRREFLDHVFPPMKVQELQRMSNETLFEEFDRSMVEWFTLTGDIRERLMLLDNEVCQQKSLLKKMELKSVQDEVLLKQKAQSLMEQSMLLQKERSLQDQLRENLRKMSDDKAAQDVVLHAQKKEIKRLQIQLNLSQEKDREIQQLKHQLLLSEHAIKAEIDSQQDLRRQRNQALEERNTIISEGFQKLISSHEHCAPVVEVVKCSMKLGRHQASVQIKEKMLPDVAFELFKHYNVFAEEDFIAACAKVKRAERCRGLAPPQGTCEPSRKAV